MARKLSRRAFAAGAVATASFRFAPASAQAAPFRIGLLTVKTGPLAQGGIQMEQGIAVFLKEKANTLAGRKIEFISADTGGNPAGAKTKAQELIERDKVNVILGPLAAFELLAITDYVRDNATPLISLAAAEDVTQRRANPFIIRPDGTSAQCCHPMGEYAAKELKYKRAATISEDFAFGYRHKHYPELPGGYSAGMYNAGQCVEVAMTKRGGKSDNPKAFAEALHQVTLTETTRGPLKFDHLGNVVGDVFIHKSERKNGK